MMLRFLNGLVFLILASGYAHADTLHIASGGPHMIRGDQISILNDTSGQMTIQDVSNSLRAFQAFDGEIPSLPYATTPYWLRFHVKNNSGSELLALEIGNPQLDSIEAFFIYKDSMRIFRLGDQMPFDTRPFDHQHFILPIRAGQGETITVYLRLRGLEQMSVPLLVGERKVILTNNYRTDLFWNYVGDVLLQPIPLCQHTRQILSVLHPVHCRYSLGTSRIVGLHF
jgi:hypothetical protein